MVLSPTKEQVEKAERWERFMRELTMTDLNVIFQYYTNPYDPAKHNQNTIRQLLTEFFETVMNAKFDDNEIIQGNITNNYQFLERRYGQFVNRKYLAPHVEQLINETDQKVLEDYYTNPEKPFTKFKFYFMEKVIHYCYDILVGNYDCLIKDKSSLIVPPKTSLKDMYGPKQEQVPQTGFPNGNSYSPNPLGYVENNQMVNGTPCFEKCGNAFKANTLASIMPPVYQTDRKFSKSFDLVMAYNLDQVQRMTPKQKYDFTEALLIDMIRVIIAGFPLFSMNFDMTFKINKL